MAKPNEERLLWKILKTRDISSRLCLMQVCKRTGSFDENLKQVWRFVLKHYSKYSEVPTAVTATDSFPTLGEPVDVEDTIDYL
jgi:hypothetical protein